MEGPKSRPSLSPLSPSPPGDPSSRDATPLPGAIQSPTATDTPLTSRLRGWDRAATPSSTSQGLRESPIAQAQPGHRRLNVAGEAEVRDPRIGHLADDAALSDDEDTQARMPPSPVNGVSPDTRFAVTDPGWDAIFRAMMFNGRIVGLDQAASVSLLRQRGVMEGLRHAVDSDLRAQGYGNVREAPDAVLRASADDATANLLRSRGHAVSQAAHPQATSPQPPSLDELEQRFAALLAKSDDKADRKG